MRKILERGLFIWAATMAADGMAASGTRLLGVTPASRAMGGTGVANYTGTTDAIYKNPALMNHSPKTGYEGTLALNYLALDISSKVSVDNAAADFEKSTAKNPTLPSLGVSRKLEGMPINFGLGFFAFGGAGVEYGDAGHNKTKAGLGLMRFTVAAAYQVNEQWNLGVAPFMTMGSLEFNAADIKTGIRSKDKAVTGNSLGAQLGASGKVTDTVTVGASLTTPSTITYKEVTDIDALLFTPDAKKDDMEIGEPMEMAVGVAFKVDESINVTSDIRQIAYGSAKTLKELGWQNQTVWGLGGSYSFGKANAMLGYSYNTTQVEETITDEDGNKQLDLFGKKVPQFIGSNFNVVAIPSYVKHHYSFGGGYTINENLGLDFGAVIAPENSVKRSGKVILAAGAPTMPYTLEGKAAASIYSFGLHGMF